MLFITENTKYLNFFNKKERLKSLFDYKKVRKLNDNIVYAVIFST